VAQSIFWYLEMFRRGSGVWQTDKRTDRLGHRIQVHHASLGCTVNNHTNTRNHNTPSKLTSSLGLHDCAAYIGTLMNYSNGRATRADPTARRVSQTQRPGTTRRAVGSARVWLAASIITIIACYVRTNRKKLQSLYSLLVTAHNWQIAKWMTQNCFLLLIVITARHQWRHQHSIGARSENPPARSTPKKLTTFFSCCPQNTGCQCRFTVRIKQLSGQIW